MKRRIIKILLTEDSKETEKQLNSIIKTAERNLTQTKEDKEPPPRKTAPNNKYKPNLKKNFLKKAPI
jgi:F0F1-type ATP synthase membrane subunit b/b'